ncbi:hypothetical protein Sme01_71310 [Sphaerisporangium melleum]|uniref:Uncharacterized protein n=1 Tax=Sphaerisporangium melleum TaxID=321316 RepID=A0A917RNY8_9ACTN|nr:hypothetical protein [Sphaerisporangium melleum]GGL16742.1 hypothetical protein GCM10007964_68430 [Sphaerisporangium melleum]GII74655.1 hypothetical protein Sme01_71310 [Sphaerisporangium melleum]
MGKEMSAETSRSCSTEHALAEWAPGTGGRWCLPAYLLPVLEELAKGTPDAAACRHLHMSGRTFSRRVAALLEALGARTRFQGGMAAVYRGILPVPAEPRFVTRRGERIWVAEGPRDRLRPSPLRWPPDGDRPLGRVDLEPQPRAGPKGDPQRGSSRKI